MTSNPIASYPIHDGGSPSVTIKVSELNPGLYFYTLIADDKEVDIENIVYTIKKKTL